MITPLHLRDYVIKPTLDEMQHVFPGANADWAVHLLCGTAAHESLGGKFLKQINGPALGIYQMEPATEQDIWDNYLSHRQNRHYFMRDLGEQDLIRNLTYATAMARLSYYRQNFQAPHLGHNKEIYVEALAHLWKRYYNTFQGAGTTNQFVDHFPMEVLDA